MIFCSLGPAAPFYRALTPSFAYQPESGAGAAVAGGRFNRPAIEARYLAATPEAALAEYQAESQLLSPATVATYQVSADRIVDFTGGYDAVRWSPIWAEAYCNWKGMAFLALDKPPSWVIGDLVREAEHPGILYRSAHFRAPVYDPAGRLPQNADSRKAR
jgi:RES domain-containing protein